MQFSTEIEILGYLDNKNIELVVPEDKEHDYFHYKKI
jgi:hypothetical protein